MLAINKVEEYFRDEKVKDYNLSDFDENYAALPNDSLEFLLNTCKTLGIKKVFEFGSGRSTKALLENNIQVVSLENNDFWLNDTKTKLNENEKSIYYSESHPLQIKFLGLFPVLDWKMNSTLLNKLSEAELVLVDSPYYVPFRESTLWTCLNYCKNAVIILDDTRIPTLQKFCNRLAKTNPDIIHQRINVGHSFDLFFIENQKTKNLKLNHSFWDIIKGWRRYFHGVLFYS